MLCLKCGYDMGNRTECPICGYSTEEPKDKIEENHAESNHAEKIVHEKPVQSKYLKVFGICSVGLVLSVICLIQVLKHYESTTHLWFENQYHEVYCDNERVTADRKAMLAVSNQGVLSYEYGNYILSDLEGRKKEVSLDLKGQIVQVIMSNSNEYIGVITNLQNQLSLNLIQVKDTGNMIIDENIDINKLLYITDIGTIMYLDKEGELVRWNRKNKQLVGNKVTQCIVFEESNTFYFLQENKELYHVNLKKEDSPQKIKSNVLSLSAKKENSWKSMTGNVDLIKFGYLEDDLIMNTTQKDTTEVIVKDENYSYGINEKKQLYRKDVIDGEITILHEGVFDFGIR
ncbi:hypothetical protein [Anaerosacchariphilus polymeriproducens]|uniref:Uncharacterized protein n=1 Tax=Anaerosacchariphilus polymeriproducens TaxID=1812858 RepID=A0A371AXD0_9FIRM|nr:hypothetical protein [Anaerosacchariphilus polymeriproducens]RDU24235.1 hypothetical protein DWV06_05930 [Anaerosacchariphilus polymeriproducens]